MKQIRSLTLTVLLLTPLVAQTAYQVVVASSEELLAKDKGDLWDSGKVISDQSIAVRYDGKPLVSESNYWWKVRVDDNVGKSSEWSKPAMFLTGKMRPEDWRGKWIGAVYAVGSEIYQFQSTLTMSER